MTTDEAFNRAYAEAEQAYQEAVRIRDQYFNDKNVLTYDKVKM